MKTTPVRFKSIDAYIATFPADKQKVLQQIRAAIHTAVPDAEEKISYHMPTFTLNGNLLYFAMFKNHVGMYGMFTAAPQFQKELAPYAGPKGALKFPLDQPIPLKLISKLAKFQAAENRKKSR